MQRCETQTEMYIKQRMFKRVRDTLDILKNQMNAYTNKKSDRGKRMIVSLIRN